MDNASLAAQAVAAGPQTLASPRFEGHGWLVVLNLAEMTAATMIALMAIIYIVNAAWRDRRDFPAWTPFRVWRVAGLLFATGIMLRCGVEAASIWGWDSTKPVETAGFLFAKSLIDPIAVPCGVAGLILMILSYPGMVEQLRRPPPPDRLWQSGAVIRNMTALASLALIAAVGVVSTR